MRRDPGVVRLARTGELASRIDRARALAGACRICPRACGVDRTTGERGYCGAGGGPTVYSHMAHPGEEPPVSGVRGSGTIFFSYCTMSCVYCQNYRFSQAHEGRDRSVDELAGLMLSLAGRGCHNINLVSPTHFLLPILEALATAAERGLNIPVIWNTSGYESSETLSILDGVVDVYLADLRYSDAAAAARYSDAPDYVDVARRALVEMNRQVGVLETTEAGVATRGLIVRHLVLPDGRSGTRRALGFIAERLGRETHVSLMAQYYPAYRASEYPEIARGISRGEWDDARAALAEAGLTHGWVQAYRGGEVSPIAGTELRADDPPEEGPPDGGPRGPGNPG